MIYFDKLSSLDAAITRAESAPYSASSHRLKDPDSDFRSHDSFDESMRDARNGWSDGLKKLQSKIKVNQLPMTRSTVWTIKPDVNDGRLKINRLLNGSEKPFDRRRRSIHESRAGAGKVIRIVYQTAASAIVDANTLYERGALVMALHDALSTVGYSIEIDLVSAWKETNGRGGDQYVQVITVKSAGSTLAPDRLVYALCASDMLRRVGFGLAETYSNRALSNRITENSYWYPTNWTPPEDQNTINVPTMIGALSTKWIASELSRFGIEVSP